MEQGSRVDCCDTSSKWVKRGQGCKRWDRPLRIRRQTAIYFGGRREMHRVENVTGQEDGGESLCGRAEQPVSQLPEFFLRD